MTCHSCTVECKRKERDRKGNQRYQCSKCSKWFQEPQDKPLEGMYLDLTKAEMVLKLLLEGNSVSSVERLTEVHHTTILKLLVLAGEKCERIMATRVVNVKVRDVECDELWAFVGKKQKRVRPDDDPNLGDCYTFVAIERHSKLVLNIAAGKRDQATTDVFIEGLRQATAPSDFQINTDGFAPYRSAISNTLSDRCDFAQLIKVYKAASEGEARYSPANIASVEVVPVHGPTRPRTNLHEHRRAKQFEHADGNAPLHSPDERLQQEMGEPLGSRCAVVHVLQFLPSPSLASCDACDGCGNQRPHLEHT